MGKQEELTNVSKYSFEDLFDIQKIEELQDAIAKAVGVGTFISRWEIRK